MESILDGIKLGCLRVCESVLFRRSKHMEVTVLCLYCNELKGEDEFH